MADTVGPVPSVGASLIPSAIPSLPPAIELAQQPPPALLLAATLSAVVIGRGGNGALLLRTDYGTLALKTPLALASGSRVELKLQPGPPATVLLLEVEEPATPAATAPATTPTPAAPATTAGTAVTPPAAPAASEAEAPPAQLAFGSEVEATLVSLPPGEQNLPALAEGTRLILRIALPVPDEPPPTALGPTPVSFAGTVLPPAADGNGHTALLTPFGTLLLDQRLALPPGTSLTLTTLSMTAPAAGELALGSVVQARVLSPPPGEAAPSLPSGTQLTLRVVVLPATPAAAAASGAMAPQTGFTGRVLAGAPGETIVETPLGTLLLDQRLPLPPGTGVTLTTLAAGAPAAGAPATGSVVQARLLSEPPSGGAAPTSSAAAPLTLRVVALPATATAGAPTIAAAPGGTAATPADFIGRVVAATAGETMVETPVGMLALEQRLALPPGTLLALQLLAATPPAPPDDASVTQSATWPALAQALSALDHALPDLAAQLRSDLMPASGQQLAGTLLFLMSALNSGAWPGAKVASALDLSGRRDLRLRLDGDIEELRQLAEPASGDWRVFVLPLLAGGLIRPVRLYLRRRAAAAAPQEPGSHFILEVETSRLGALQLDGLVRPQRFDLVLRSHRPLFAEMRHEIAEIFRNATTASGLAGDISFATASRFAVAPLEALRPHVGLTA